ncbi:hypothetical protein H0H87_006941 [Tephrocybe sp. NHM501043]|nr:hypothetical protein H0H87_006941 [Tephrocybe sp. NHM501043]
MLMLEPQYSRLKKLFSDCRASFRSNPVAQGDLDAYHRRDDSHDYTMLPGLVPNQVVGDASAGGGVPYNRSDAFFTVRLSVPSYPDISDDDFLEHYPEDYVLSSSELSLIIANRSSHDVRQYGVKWDPSTTPRDRSASAGMSFVHLMVIPKHKGALSGPYRNQQGAFMSGWTRPTVYNAVSLDDPTLIEEMITHFKRFWSQPDAVHRTARGIQHAVDLRTSEVAKGLENMQVPTMAVTASAEFKVLMQDSVQKSTNELLFKLGALNVNDFFFGFHATPHASVGHLHMHVLAADTEFRRYSTGVHDWKTIPAAAVMEVIREEKAAKGH